MTNADPTTSDLWRAVCSPLPTDPRNVSRRSFLQAAAVAGGAAMVPSWLAEAAGAATPLGPGDGVLVLVTMNGGNDGLNMVIPTQQGVYYDKRRELAIPAAGALPITDDRALHPNLTTVNALWRTGDVAIIEGVGTPTTTDLSHFSSMARWMAGSADHLGLHSGWLGRYVDGLPGGDDPFHAVNIGTSIPLVVQGEQRQASGLPAESDSIFQIAGADPSYQRQYNALAAYGASSTGLGELADALAANGQRAVELAGTIEAFYQQELPEDPLSAKLDLAARLINANLGIRVISVAYGDFDSHADQPTMHTERMIELNEGLSRFYQRLDPGFAARTLLLTVSEFGRRLRSNYSSGTDHGTASTLLAIGQQVDGGFYGEHPSLTDVDRHGNLKPTVDYRSVYASVLDGWLDADSSQVLNGHHENLGFVAAPAPSRTTSGRLPEISNPVFKYRAQIIRLYRAYFGRLPDSAGLDHWVSARRTGLGLAAVSEAFASSVEFVNQYGHLSNRQFADLVYRNVLGRSPDGAGLDYWTAALDQGTGRGTVMLGFSESAEFVGAVEDDVAEVDQKGPVARLYRAYFLRSGETDGLRYWIGSGLSYEAISDAFAESGEFGSRYGSVGDADFVELVYQNVLGRSADAAGRAYWREQLGRGVGRGSVMLGFSESPEFVVRTNTLP